MSQTANHTPMVSVVMATFNEVPEMIGLSINSVLQQTFANFELLIIDDSNRIETVQTIDTFAKADSRVRVIRSATRFGFVPALNEGLRQAKGQFIARMDGDDISEPTRLEKELTFLNQYPNIAIVGTAMKLINEEGNIISSRSYPLTHKQIRRRSIFRNPMAHPTVMIRKDVIDKGNFYDETFKKAEDFEFWLRLMKNNFLFANLPNELLHYRIIENMTQKRDKENFKYALKAKWKNFDIHYPLANVLAIIFGCTLYIIPSFILCFLYNAENNKY